MTDAQIARRRSLEAMGQTDDLRTKIALWRCAKRYNERVREEVAGAALENAGPPFMAQLGARKGHEG